MSALWEEKKNININDYLEAQKEKLKEISVVYADQNIACISKPANEYIEAPEDDDIDFNIATSDSKCDLVKLAKRKYTIVDAMNDRFYGYLDIKIDNGIQRRELPKLCHRIDYPTSGILIYGLNGWSTGAFCRSFQDRHVHKAYIALLYGHLNSDVNTKGTNIDSNNLKVITSNIGRDKTDENDYRMTADEEKIRDGRYSETRIHVISRGYYKGKTTECGSKSSGKENNKKEANGTKVTLVMFLPFTGRTHQLRVHSSLIDHSIVGDLTYFKCSEIQQTYTDRNSSDISTNELIDIKRNGETRLFLHSWLLYFDSTPIVRRKKFPQYEKKMFEAPVPPEFFTDIEYIDIDTTETTVELAIEESIALFKSLFDTEKTTKDI